MILSCCVKCLLSAENDSVEDEVETVEPSSSCSSPGQEDNYYPYGHDNQVDWRMDQMIPAPVRFSIIASFYVGTAVEVNYRFIA